jgi:hypothetical protein
MRLSMRKAKAPKPEPKENPTFSSQIADRLKQVDAVHADAVKGCKELQKGYPDKIDQMFALVEKLGKQLEKNPDDKALQKEYAGACSARDMLQHGNNYNDSLIEDAETN